MLTKYDALKPIFDNLQLKSKVVSLAELLNIVSNDKYNLKNDIGCASATVNRILNQLAPDRITGERLCVYLLRVNNLKYCSNCNLVKSNNYFSKNVSKTSGYQSSCKDCSKAYFDGYYPNYYENNREIYVASKLRYKLRLKEASPKWADLNKIKEIYANCPPGYHVDHYYPLQGDTVCGLHVENNLQYLTAFDNTSKGNKMPKE